MKGAFAAVQAILAARKSGTKGVALLVLVLAVIGNLLLNDPTAHALVISGLTKLLTHYPHAASIIAALGFIGALLHDSIDAAASQGGIVQSQETDNAQK